MLACVCRYVQKCEHVVGLGVQKYMLVSVSNEGPDGYTGQAHVGLRGPAQVDGVPVQANVLQRVPYVVEVLQVAESVFMHHLNVVSL